MAVEKFPHSISSEDAARLICAKAHLGSQNLNNAMAPYVYNRTKAGINVFDISKTWENLILACRVLAAVTVPSDIVFVSTRKSGQRAVLKAARYIGATPIAGKFTPGTFTNCLSKGYKEPRVVFVTDPTADSQAIREAALVNVPVIAFCDSDCTLQNIDLVIPCGTRTPLSIGLMWWMLTRELLYMTGSEVRFNPWSVMPDMFFYRDAEAEKEIEASRKEAALNASKINSVSGALAAPVPNMSGASAMGISSVFANSDVVQTAVDESSMTMQEDGASAEFTGATAVAADGNAWEEEWN